MSIKHMQQFIVNKSILLTWGFNKCLVQLFILYQNQIHLSVARMSSSYYNVILFTVYIISENFQLIKLKE